MEINISRSKLLKQKGNVEFSLPNHIILPTRFKDDLNDIISRAIINIIDKGDSDNERTI